MLGPIEVLFLLAVALIFWGLAIVALIVIAENKGRSRHFAWWAVGLGWIGFIIAAVIMLTGPAQTRPGDGGVAAVNPWSACRVALLHHPLRSSTAYAWPVFPGAVRSEAET